MVGLILLTGENLHACFKRHLLLCLYFLKALGLYNYLLFKLRLGSKKLILLREWLVEILNTCVI